jgi:hypothetical protein
MTEKLNNIEQRNLGNEIETTGINPEVISPSNESFIPEIPKVDQTRFNLSENSSQGGEVFSSADKGETDKEGANTSIGDEWHRIIEGKQEGSTEIPL